MDTNSHHEDFDSFWEGKKDNHHLKSERTLTRKRILPLLGNERDDTDTLS